LPVPLWAFRTSLSLSGAIRPVSTSSSPSLLLSKRLLLFFLFCSSFTSWSATEAPRLCFPLKGKFGLKVAFLAPYHAPFKGNTALERVPLRRQLPILGPPPCILWALLYLQSPCLSLTFKGCFVSFPAYTRVPYLIPGRPEFSRYRGRVTSVPD